MLIPNKNKSKSSVPQEQRPISNDSDKDITQMMDLWNVISEGPTTGPSFDNLSNTLSNTTNTIKSKVNKFVQTPQAKKLSDLGHLSLDIGAGVLPMLNSYMDSQNAVQQANDTIQSNVFGQVSPKKRFNMDFVGENDPLFALHAKDGASIGTSMDGSVPVNAEGGELYLKPSTGEVLPIEGKSHAEGGVNFKAEDGSFVLSDTLKISKEDLEKYVGIKVKTKEFTIAEVVKRFPHHFDVSKEQEMLDNQALDPIQKNTIGFNMKQKLEKLSKLLAYQQEKNGNNGEEMMMYGGEATYAKEGASIQDYLVKKGIDGSYENRKKLFSSIIPNYSGTAEQNTLLLSKFESGEIKVDSSNNIIAKKNNNNLFGTGDYMKDVIKNNSKYNPNPTTTETTRYNSISKFNKTTQDIIMEVAKRNNGKVLITDKGSKQTIAGTIKNGKIDLIAFPVLTGQQDKPGQYPDGYTFNEASKNKNVRITPTGAFSVNKQDIYGETGFNLNGLMDAYHITYPDEKKIREPKYSDNNPNNNNMSWGCVNCRKKDIDFLSANFNTNDSAYIIDTRLPYEENINIINTNFHVKKKEMGGQNNIIAKKGSKNKYQEAQSNFTVQDKAEFNKQLEEAVKRGDKTFNFKGLSYAAKQDPNYKSGMMKNSNGLTLGDNYTDDDAKAYYGNPNATQFPASNLRSKNSSVQTTKNAGYATVDMSNPDYQMDFRNRHSDVWQQFNMGDWKASDYMDRTKVKAVQEALNKKGYNIKTDGYFGQETFQVPGTMGNLEPLNALLDIAESPFVPKETITSSTPDSNRAKPKPKQDLYKARLKASDYLNLIDDPSSTNYHPVYNNDEVNPNLISLRSAKNDIASQFNTLVNSNTGNPSVDNLRKNAGFAEVMKANSQIAEQENNTNAGILNQFAQYNNGIKQQNMQLQQAANHQFVTENNQDLAARLDAKRKKFLDFAENARKVDQYNAQLNLLQKTFGDHFKIVNTPDGPGIERNGKIVNFDGLNNITQLMQWQQALQTNPYSKTEDADNGKTTKKKMGGKNTKKRLL